MVYGTSFEQLEDEESKSIYYFY